MSKAIDDRIEELMQESKKASDKRQTEIVSEIKNLITQKLEEGPELSEMKERAADLDKRSSSPKPEDRTSAQINEGKKLQSEYRNDLEKIAKKAKRIRPQQMFETSWRKEKKKQELQEDKENESGNRGPKT